MKKKLLTVLTIAVALAAIAIASGCGATATGQSQLSADKYKQITTGMSADQVKSIAGDPAKTESKDTGSMPGMQMNGDKMDYWYYQGSQGWVRLEISGGKVTNKSGY